MANFSLPTRPDGRPLKGRAVASYLKFAARIGELGATLLEPHWLGCMEKHRVRCAAGHECAPKPNNVINGRGVCGTCASNHPATAEERFRARVAELGGIVIGKYTGAHALVKVRCSANHECTPRPSSVLSGQGLCKICAGRDPAACEERFRVRVAELGGTVTGDYAGRHAPVEVLCAAGHTGYPWPSFVLSGGGICAACSGKVWDVFYVVTGPAGVKIGITSGDPRGRLSVHRRSGYNTVVRVHEGLPGTTARDLESELLDLLRASGVKPVRGKEYFPAAVLPVVLYVVDDCLGDTGGELIADAAA